MPVGIKSSGGGTTTLVAESSATNYTATLPANSGTVVTTGSTAVVTSAMIGAAAVGPTNMSGAQSGSAPIFGVRAWANFDGSTNPPTIRASGNVSGITYNSTGDYTITFATAMPDANYVAVGSGQRFVQTQSGTHTTTQLQITCQNLAGNQSNDPNINVIVLR